MKTKIHQLISATPTDIIKLHGDASNRIYYRLDFADRASLILMQLPPGPSSVSEEITNAASKPTELPFITIDRFLRSKNLPAPEILAYSASEGLMILEDFGPETFEKRILASTPEIQKNWYQKAIDLMITMQSQCDPQKHSTSDCVAYTRSFDATLLNWEFDHFFEFGIEARLNKKIAEEDLKTLRQHAQAITAHLVTLPQTFVHRDFQSKNLMVQNEALKLLDFQDALLGPLPYDLVALLRDSYIALPADTVKELVAYYVEQKSKNLPSPLKGDIFLKDFDWMTIQRKLKDAGRFVYIDRVKKNPNFLQHIPNSLQYVKEAFSRCPELKEFFTLLQKYVPEFL